MVQVKAVHNSGTLPIICESISHVSIGCVSARSKLQKGLDSYQEEDLALLRNKWTDALAKRRDYLDEQLQKIMNKEGKQYSDFYFGLCYLCDCCTSRFLWPRSLHFLMELAIFR